MEIDDRPLIVSIWCLTYNHEKYIRQCLDGFVMQKTNFRFEAIVHDDASTDGTADIVREYAKKYPDIIKPIYETENQYSKNDGSLDRIMYETCIGKYIAFCEGDDYWTDPLKLQKQVDWMEAHLAFSCCCHEFKKYYQSSGQFEFKKHKVLNANPNGFIFDLSYHGWLVQPLSLLFRRDMLDWIKFLKCKKIRDNTFVYFLLKAGKGFLMPDVMSVYRIHENGACSGTPFASYFLKTLEYESYIIDVDNCKESLDCLYYTFKENLFYLFIYRDISAIKHSLSYSLTYLPFIKTLFLLTIVPYKIFCYYLKIICNKLVNQ